MVAQVGVAVCSGITLRVLVLEAVVYSQEQVDQVLTVMLFTH